MSVHEERVVHSSDARSDGGEGASAPSSIRVNGAAISEADVSREIQHHPASSLDDARNAAELALVVRELLLTEARRKGLYDTPSDSEKTGFESSIERLLQEEIDLPEADLAACRRYYEQNKERFRSPEIYEASHILLPASAEDENARALAEEEARELLHELEPKPERFRELAREHSACSSATEGGFLGQLTTGQTTPEFEVAAAKLAPGEHSGEPVSTRYGYHIIKLHRRVEGRQLPFLVVKESIQEYLHMRSWNEAVHQYISILAGQADIEGIDIDGATSPLVQ